MASVGFKRLVRFIPKSDVSKILIGQPVRDDVDVDVGLALRRCHPVHVNVFSGSSILQPGYRTDTVELVERILSPLSASQVGTIRCVGLNYKQHAREVGMAIPEIPTIFMKPSTALGDPWPAPTLLPKLTQQDDCGDYESELAVIIGRSVKNVSEDEALDHVLGYTAANDISSRTSQFNQSQWSFSKSFDSSCPLGPCVVSKSLIPDPSKLRLRGVLNSTVVQDCGTDDTIFSVAKLISFLSQSTTLPPGTLIITGTPAGVGFARKPKLTLKHGDEFAVEISPHIGTLINIFENE